MICDGCSHSKRDHATGRCVNSTMAFVAAVGGTVRTVCRCKRYTDRPVKAPEPVVETVEEPTEEPQEETYGPRIFRGRSRTR